MRYNSVVEARAFTQAKKKERDGALMSCKVMLF
jgi:hypothetical protein